MSLSDIAGVAGAVMMLCVYGAVAMGRLSPVKAPAHLINLIGALLVLYSLYFDFNLAAAIMEVAWATVAIVGLTRLALRRPPSPK